MIQLLTMSLFTARGELMYGPRRTLIYLGSSRTTRGGLRRALKRSYNRLKGPSVLFHLQTERRAAALLAVVHLSSEGRRK